VKNPVLTAADVTDIPADFIADPFMLKTNGLWYLFFEVLHAKRNKGEIGFATSQDGFQWQYQHIILREDFHLSYPYVFEINNEFYMIPESYQDQSVRLYKATNFPHQWQWVNTILQGKDFVDASIVQFQDRWWLFTTTPRNDILNLYSAPELMGVWVEHPQSPIITANARIARPAGRIICHNQQLIRYSQDDETIYGKQVSAFIITELTPERYREEPVSCNPILKANGLGWNAVGMHHLDPHELEKNQWIACVDGYYNSYVLGCRS
jgi:hypothetical protein